MDETPTAPPAAEQAADLADLILSIARRIQAKETHFTDVIRLSNLDSLVMRHIDRHPGSRPSTIASDLGIRSANMSAALRSLEAKGLIRRDPDPLDGRGVIVHPTSVAAENLRRLRTQWAEVMPPATPDLDTLVAALTFLDETL